LTPYDLYQLKREQMTEASKRINKLLNLTKSSYAYLEVGVEKGETFSSVNASQKVAVDPKFKFDPKSESFAIDNAYYHEITSDSFFESIHYTWKFDLIFLDGLHEYEQTYRDFVNSLTILNEKGIIVMDDTFPNDVFSSHRQHSVLKELRSKFAGDPSSAWHGDVYKCLLLIAFYHPKVEYCTLMGKGIKSQTFLWMNDNCSKESSSAETSHSASSRTSPNPNQGNILKEVVNNMHQAHYLWLLENITVLNPVNSIEDVINAIESSRI
jgi:hypothetical protein